MCIFSVNFDGKINISVILLCVCSFSRKIFRHKKNNCFRPRRQPRSPTKVGIPQPIQKKTSLSSVQKSKSPSRNLLEANNNRQIRPGTYKKSGSTPCDEDDGVEGPTREDIIAMVEVRNNREILFYATSVREIKKTASEDISLYCMPEAV